MLEPFTPILAAQYLVASGCFAIFLSSWLGVAMLIPHQTANTEKPRRVHWKQIGAAHIDWILLGLMSCAAGGLIVLFDLTLAKGVIVLMMFGAWINPTAYLFKGFGINAFSFSGGGVQRIASVLAGTSSAAILLSWSLIFFEILK